MIFYDAQFVKPMLVNGFIAKGNVFVLHDNVLHEHEDLFSRVSVLEIHYLFLMILFNIRRCVCFL